MDNFKLNIFNLSIKFQVKCDEAQKYSTVKPGGKIAKEKTLFIK